MDQKPPTLHYHRPQLPLEPTVLELQLRARKQQELARRVLMLPLLIALAVILGLICTTLWRLL